MKYWNGYSWRNYTSPRDGEYHFEFSESEIDSTGVEITFCSYGEGLDAELEVVVCDPEHAQCTCENHLPMLERKGCERHKRRLHTYEILDAMDMTDDEYEQLLHQAGYTL